VNSQSVVFLAPSRYPDSRGFFSETWNKKLLTSKGIDVDFVQDNQSISYETGTVRGLHFQAPPYAQAKLVRCGRGRIFDVAVDIRVGSPNYGQWVGLELSFENGKQVFIPEGFLHGFVTLEPNTEIIYKCSNYYSSEHQGEVRFDDPDINIKWPIELSNVGLSEKDETAPYLKGIKNPFIYRVP
jgi:dTDP-4-dehydrorhamnose 3,5-epimerase